MDQLFAKFFVGQVVHHKLFDYRGVVVNADATFQRAAISRPPKDQPWYNVLVHGGQVTYVAERNLEADSSQKPIRHPQLRSFFESFDVGEGVYRSAQKMH